MTRNDDVEEQPAGRPEGLDPRLQRAFEDAYQADLSLDVAARHLWRIDRFGRPVTVRETKLERWRRTARTACLGAALLGLPILLGQASMGALPGDVLYPVKRQYEDVQLRTAASWSTRDAYLMAQARQRLSEARAIANSRPQRLLDVVADARAAINQLNLSPDLGDSEADALRSETVRTVTDLSIVVDDDTRRRLHAAMEGLGHDGRDGRLRAVALDTPDGAPEATESSPVESSPVESSPVESSPTKTVEQALSSADAGSEVRPATRAATVPSAGASGPVEPEPLPREPIAGEPTSAGASDFPTLTAAPTISPVPTADAGDPDDCDEPLGGPSHQPTASPAPPAADEEPLTPQVFEPAADALRDCRADAADPVVADPRSEPPTADPTPTAAAPAPVADVSESASTDGADE